MRLICYDFDGTISNCDSFLLFMRQTQRSRFAFACIALLPKIVLFLFGKYPNQKLKEDFLKILYRGEKLSRLKEQASAFCTRHSSDIIRPGALDSIQNHLDRGETVVVVTASPRLFLEPWCTARGIGIIGTELQIDENDCVTGELDGLNCRGEEKVKRIKKRYQLKDFTEIVAYGDSPADLHMLELASTENRYYKPFR